MCLLKPLHIASVRVGLICVHKHMNSAYMHLIILKYVNVTTLSITGNPVKDRFAGYLLLTICIILFDFACTFCVLIYAHRYNAPLMSPSLS